MGVRVNIWGGNPVQTGMIRLIRHARPLFPLAVLTFLGSFGAPQVAPAQIFVSVRVGPPALPVYAQPPCPTPGYLWNPGYWAYGPMGYYWVPGVWIAPPRVGLLWTPGYWGYAGGLYVWHGGYWGPHVGFYGGVNYGYGYGGFGFGGGMWSGGIFRYNTAVVNVNNTVVRDVYVDRTVINNTTIVNRASFNGPGGVMAQPHPEERAFDHEQRFEPTGHQLRHMENASQDRNQLAAMNHGRPNVASMDAVNGRHFAPDARMAEQQQIHQERQSNGGHLNQQEKRQVNREQNRASRRIQEERHAHGERR